MECKVIDNFIDSKDNDKFYKVGDKYTCIKARFEEIQKKGNFLEEVKSTKKATKKETKDDKSTRVSK